MIRTQGARDKIPMAAATPSIPRPNAYCLWSFPADLAVRAGRAGRSKRSSTGRRLHPIYWF